LAELEIHLESRSGEESKELKIPLDVIVAALAR